MSQERVYHFQSPRKAAKLPGFRRDATWRREWAPDGAGNPDLSTGSLLCAAVGAYMRRGKVWTEADRQTHEELEARSWRYYEVDQRRSIAVPTWLTAVVAHPRWWWILAVLVQAYRAGCVGVMLSYEEAATLCGCSRRTWARWIATLHAAGLITIIPTRCKATSRGRNRDKGMNVYQAGPALMKAAGYEGAAEDLGEGRKKWVRRSLARAARKVARAVRRETRDRIYKAQRRATPTPSKPPAIADDGRGPAKPEPVPERPNPARGSATMSPSTSVKGSVVRGGKGSGAGFGRSGTGSGFASAGENEPTRKRAGGKSLGVPPATANRNSPQPPRSATTGSAAFEPMPLQGGTRRGGGEIRADASRKVRDAIARVADSSPELAALLRAQVLGTT